MYSYLYHKRIHISTYYIYIRININSIVTIIINVYTYIYICSCTYYGQLVLSYPNFRPPEISGAPGRSFRSVADKWDTSLLRLLGQKDRTRTILCSPWFSASRTQTSSAQMWNTPFQFALNKSIAWQRSTLHRLEPLCCYTMRSAAIAGRALRIFTVCPQQRLTLGVCNTLIILALGVWTAYVSEPDSKTSPNGQCRSKWSPMQRSCKDSDWQSQCDLCERQILGSWPKSLYPGFPARSGWRNPTAA